MKIIIYALTLLVTALTMYVYKDITTIPEVTFKTIKTYYYVVEGALQTLDVQVYVHNSQDALLDTKTIDRVTLFNDTILLDVTLNRITYSHQEIYNEVSYDSYIFDITLPSLGQNEWIDSLQMTIDYMNQTSVTLYLGVLEYFINGHQMGSSWSSIDAIRDETLMTIKAFHIKSLPCDARVFVSNTYQVNQTCINDFVVLTLKSDDVIFTHVPLIIDTNEAYEWIIGMSWITSKRMLVQTEGYHYEYTYHQTL